jgi:hypothetical protein
MESRREWITHATHKRNLFAAFGQVREIAGQNNGLVFGPRKSQRLLDDAQKEIPQQPRAAGEKPILVAPGRLVATDGPEDARDVAQTQSAKRPDHLALDAHQNAFLGENAPQASQQTE